MSNSIMRVVPSRAVSSRVVTSLNQWAPLPLDLEPDEPFAAILPKVHWKAFNALKNGACSPDAIWQIRDEHSRLDPRADPGFYYNPMLAPPGFPSDDRLEAPAIEGCLAETLGGRRL